MDLCSHHVKARTLPQRSETCIANGVALADGALPSPLLSHRDVVVVLGRAVRAAATSSLPWPPGNVGGSTVLQLPRRPNGNPTEGLLNGFAMRLDPLLAARHVVDVLR